MSFLCPSIVQYTIIVYLLGYCFEQCIHHDADLYSLSNPGHVNENEKKKMYSNAC